MVNAQEFPQAQFDKVHELINLAKEQIEEGPANKEWLLDFNLPDLYVAIAGLYDALGESSRLERAKTLQEQDVAPAQAPPPSPPIYGSHSCSI